MEGGVEVECYLFTYLHKSGISRFNTNNSRVLNVPDLYREYLKSNKIEEYPL